jgi:hypothetical protein
VYVSSAYLESSLLPACPGLRESWDAVRRTYAPGTAPDDAELLRHVRAHVVGLLVSGRVAEFSRFARTVERLLADADPILRDLLERELLRPLARDLDEANVAPALVMPHLGPHARSSLGEMRHP